MNPASSRTGMTTLTKGSAFARAFLTSAPRSSWLSDEFVTLARSARTRAACFSCESRAVRCIATLAAQTGNDRAELPGCGTGKAARFFHGHCHPGSKTLEDTAAKLVLVARPETCRRNDANPYPVQCFLHDLAFSHIGLVHEDPVEADHLAAVRTD